MTKASTKRKDARTGFVPGSSRGPRNARTFLLQMAMEQERQREVGERIKARREELRLTQPVVAERVPVTLRAYQEWEAGGGISWPNLEKLARTLKVSEDFLLYGSEEDRESMEGSQLDRIERMLEQVLSLLGAQGFEDEVRTAGDQPRAPRKPGSAAA